MVTSCARTEAFLAGSGSAVRVPGGRAWRRWESLDDGAALLLTREDRASSTAEGAMTAARALRNLLVHVEPQAVAAALIDEFPWSDVLPEQTELNS